MSDPKVQLNAESVADWPKGKCPVCDQEVAVYGRQDRRGYPRKDAGRIMPHGGWGRPSVGVYGTKHCAGTRQFPAAHSDGSPDV